MSPTKSIYSTQTITFEPTQSITYSPTHDAQKINKEIIIAISSSAIIIISVLIIIAFSPDRSKKTYRLQIYFRN